jgi:hypothetical protein
MDGGSVAMHKDVRVDDVVDSPPLFPVSLSLNKTELSRADSICSTRLPWAVRLGMMAVIRVG